MSAPLKVPLLSLRGPLEEVGAEMRAAVSRVLDSGVYVLGPENAAFDREFARVLGAPLCVGVDSGTSALEIALQAVGVGPGDEVVVPAFTFVATATAASVLGARPVFADCDPDTLTLDPRSLERLLTPRTKAVVPVHLFGQPADMGPILSLAKARGVAVVEDCAQSHLASYNGRMTGTLGQLAAFSFYPTKNLGAAGDAGAIVVNDESLAEAVGSLRNCGRAPGAAYRHARIGHNARLDEIQAAVLRVKLARLSAWTEERRRLARRYHEALSGLPLALPPQGAGGTHPVFHLYTVRTPKRDALQEHLRREGVGSGVYYPIPAHRQPAFASLEAPALPVTERACAEVLSLPLYPGLSDADQDLVADAVRRFFR